MLIVINSKLPVGFRSGADFIDKHILRDNLQDPDSDKVKIKLCD